MRDKRFFRWRGVQLFLPCVSAEHSRQRFALVTIDRVDPPRALGGKAPIAKTESQTSIALAFAMETKVSHSTLIP